MADAAVSSDLEAGRILTGLARGRFGRIAPERIARHVLQSQAGADWSVLKASFDALARRYGFAQRDALHVAERPADGMFGSYRTSGQARQARPAEGTSGHTRPYETALYQVDPLIMSCGCPDFVRSSLGLCKHGLVVLELLEQRGELQRAAQAAPARAPDLRWDYAQPLPGPFDRLLRLRCAVAAVSGGATKYFQNTKLACEAIDSLPARAEVLAQLERALSSAALRAEPAVHTLLAEELTRVEQQRALQPQLQSALASLAQCKRQLYPYQLEGVQRFLERGRLLLADDMGLGKTTQAIAASHALVSAGCVTRVLLIVPTPLKSQWKREWDSTTDVPLALVEGSPKERKRLYRTTRRGALVLGYEQLLRDLEHVQSFAPELVVLDEAQRIKNWATKSAAYVKSLAPAYRLVLTGTPMENRFDELASIMDFVDDLALEPKWRLVPYHTVTQPGDKVDKVVAGARNLDVLRTRLSSAMLRRTRSSVLSQLPERTDTRIPVEMTEVQRAAHDELRQPIAELSARAERRALGGGELMRLMQLLTTQRMICNGMAQLRFDTEWPRCESAKPTPALLDSLFAPKLSVLRGLIEQVVIEQRRKVVVFSQWRKLLCFAEWAVRDVLAESGMRALFFTGAETLRAREQAIVDFHEDATASVLFSSDAGATGLNLQRAASCCINLELPWNPAVLEQRIARVHRLGQTQPIDVYNLVTEDGIEGRIAKLLEQKQALFSSLFDGTSDQVAFEGQTGFVESMKQLLEPMPAGFVSAAGADPEGDAGELALTPLAAADDSAPAPSPSVPSASAEPPSLEALGIGVTRKKNGRLQLDVPEALSSRVDEWLPLLAERLRSR